MYGKSYLLKMTLAGLRDLIEKDELIEVKRCGECSSFESDDYCVQHYIFVYEDDFCKWVTPREEEREDEG